MQRKTEGSRKNAASIARLRAGRADSLRHACVAPTVLSCGWQSGSPVMAVNMRDISVASFNLYNLQLPDAPMYPQSRPYSAEEFAAKMRWAAETIGRLDADVIVFQEVWSREALEAVLAEDGRRSELPDGVHHRGRLGRGGGGLRGAGALGDPGGRRATRRSRRRCGWSSASSRWRRSARRRRRRTRAIDPERDPTFVPSQEDEGVRVAIDEFSRSVLQVTVGHARAPEVPAIEVFVTHLKSKLATPLDNPEYRDPAVRPHAAALGTALSTIRRIAEAAALRIIVDGGDARRRQPGAGGRRLQRRHLLGRARGALGPAELPGGGGEHGGGAQRHRALHRGAAPAAALARRRLLHPRVPQRARGDRPRAGQRAVLRLVGTGGSGRSRRCASSTTTWRTGDRRRSDHGQVVARFDWEPVAAVSG